MAADLEKIVKIIFAGDDSGLAKTINSIGGGLDTLSGKVSKATQPMADLTDAVLKIDAVLAGLAAGSLVIAVNAAGKFGDSFKEISTLIDIPADKLEIFSQGILDYANNSTQSIADINSAIYNAISAGEDYATALDLLAEAEKLGIATKADLNQAINVLKPTMNAFGVSTDEAADYADILFTTVKNGKTTLSELEPVLANVTGIAAAGGVPFEDLAAAIAGLTAAGVPTAQAITQIKGALVAVLAPTDAAREAAKTLGIEIGQEAVEAKGLDVVLRDMAEATGGNVEQMKALIPRVEGANAAIILGQDAAGKYGDALDAMSERAGAAGVAYEKMKENFELVNQALINNLQSTLIKAGGPLLDEWGKLADAIADVFKGLDVSIDAGAFDDIIKFIEKLAADITGEIEGMAEALPEALEGIDWSGFIGALEDLIDAGKGLFTQLFGDLDLTKIDDLETAIQKVVDVFENWIDFTTGIIEGIGPFLGGITDLISKFTELDEGALKSAGNIAGWGKAINTVAEFIPSLTAPLNLLSGAIGVLSITQIPGFILSLSGLTPALTAAASALGPLAAGAAALSAGWVIGSKIGKDIPILGDAGTAFGNLAFAIANLGDDSVEAMEKQAAHTQELAAQALQLVATKEAAGELADQVKDPLSVEFSTDFEGIQNDFDSINAEIDELVQAGEIPITTEVDREKVKQDVDFITITVDGIDVQVPVELDSEQAVKDAETTKEKIDEKLPSEKLLEIKLQGEIDIELEQIKATAETLQTLFEWEAKIEIAQIEADAEVVIGIADNIGKAFESTGDVISAALGVLTEDLTAGRWLDVIKIIKREQEVRENLAESLIKLQQAQTDLLTARQDAFAQGKGIIQITTDGIEPELEQVLYKIIQKAQVKANEEGFNALLGI